MARIRSVRKAPKFGTCWMTLHALGLDIEALEALENAVKCVPETVWYEEHHGTPGNGQWDAWHRSGISGSESMAIINGSDGWQSNLQVYMSKWDVDGRSADATAMPDTDSDEYSMPMDCGVALEPVIRKHYLKQQGLTECDIFSIPTGFRSVEVPYIIGSPDGFIPSQKKGVEFKHSQKRTEWGAMENAEVPLKYYLQCQHYMLLTGLPLWDLVVLLPQYELKVYPLERDDELLANMLEHYRRFWMNHVTPAIPPAIKDYSPPEVLKSIQSYYNSVTADVMDLSDIEPVVANFFMARETRLAQDKIEKACKSQILATMQNACQGTAGSYDVYRKQNIKGQVKMTVTRTEDAE